MTSILIADDLATVRRLLQFALNRQHTVIEAQDGAEALDLLRQHRPNIAILDVAMPGLSGLQVCRLLRDDPDLCDMGIIIISANATEAEALRAGADRFIPKPFLPSVLLAAVDDLIQTQNAVSVVL